jgi:hypothetical protein
VLTLSQSVFDISSVGSGTQDVFLRVAYWDLKISKPFGIRLSSSNKDKAGRKSSDHALIQSEVDSAGSRLSLLVSMTYASDEASLHMAVTCVSRPTSLCGISFRQLSKLFNASIAKACVLWPIWAGSLANPGTYRTAISPAFFRWPKYVRMTIGLESTVKDLVLRTESSLCHSTLKLSPYSVIADQLLFHYCVDSGL